jgi:hypothetical protein
MKSDHVSMKVKYQHLSNITDEQARNELVASINNGIRSGTFKAPENIKASIHLVEQSGKEKRWDDWEDALSESYGKWGIGFLRMTAKTLGGDVQAAEASEEMAEEYEELLEEQREEREEKREKKQPRRKRTAPVMRRPVIWTRKLDKLQEQLWIEDLLGEDFETLTQARRELKRIMKAGKRALKRHGKRGK